MDGASALLDLVSTIYAAPGSAQGWASVLGETTRLVGAKTSGYMLVDKETLSLEFSAMHGYPPAEMRELYEGGGAARRDIRVSYMDNLVPGRVFREFEYVPDRAAYDANEWIRHDLEKRGVYWNMTARISTHGLWTDVIAVNRLKSRGPFGDREKAALQTTLPHLSQAAELHRLVSRLESNYGAVLAVLDKFLIGLVILDIKARVVIANVAAQRAIDESGALRFQTGGYLHATDGEVDLSLQELIDDAARTSSAQGTCHGAPLVAPSRVAGADLLLELIPIRDDGLPDGDHVKGVAVFVIDPRRTHVLRTNGLARIFGLTATEGEIVRCLVNGDKPNAIAEQRRTSPLTVRGQIKTIFAKAGAGSQSDLVRLAAKMEPPIEGC
ncbi:MAG: LuxR C-terminal-related transcriptional regulator [Woeseia sp.]